MLFSPYIIFAAVCSKFILVQYIYDHCVVMHLEFHQGVINHKGFDSFDSLKFQWIVSMNGFHETYTEYI